MWAKDGNWWSCLERGSGSAARAQQAHPTAAAESKGSEDPAEQMSKTRSSAQQLHYYLSIIFGSEFRVSFYRFVLFAPCSYWGMEISREERGEHYVVVSKRNFVLN